jgi:hypothetical protein
MKRTNVNVFWDKYKSDEIDVIFDKNKKLLNS